MKGRRIFHAYDVPVSAECLGLTEIFSFDVSHLCACVYPYPSLLPLLGFSIRDDAAIKSLRLIVVLLHFRDESNQSKLWIQSTKPFMLFEKHASFTYEPFSSKQVWVIRNKKLFDGRQK